MKRVIGVFCLLLAVLLAVAPLPAQAETKNIWPNEFTPVPLGSASMADVYDQIRRHSNSLGSVGVPVYFESEFKLPAGKKITRLGVSASSPSCVELEAVLCRVSFGNEAVRVAHVQAWRLRRQIHVWPRRKI